MIFWDFKGKLDYVDKWLLMDSPLPLLIIWTSYLLFVLKFGPEYMQNRTPYKLKNTIAAYNVLQVVYSGYIFYLGVHVIKSNGLYPGCFNNIDDTKSYVVTLHYFFLAKLAELLDTVFFVLRKKQQQVTFLHINHHSYMVVFTWLMLKYDPSYMSILPGALNSLIHVFMYTYYALSAYPSFSKYLWWKKYLTILQLIQFVIIIVHVCTSFMISECPPSAILVYSLCLNVLLFLFLFVDFYLKTYLNKNRGTNKRALTDNGIICMSNMDEPDSKINRNSVSNDGNIFDGIDEQCLRITRGFIKMD